MSKHTPGPWATDEAEHDTPYQDIRVKAGWRGICTVWIDDAPAPDFNAEQEANARLIAAAPELLALAERVARLNPDAGEIGPGMLAQLVDEARRAVAAAEVEL